MLRGNAAGLRARLESDVAILHSELYDDAEEAAAAAGFVREGTLRRSAWLDGDFADEVVLGLLSAEWNAGRHGRGVDDVF
jgi:hypothetical protein